MRANGVPALKIEKLTKTYSNGFLALDGVSLEVEAGKFFGLLGPNGAGKTTLINGVVSLARPDSGSVEVFGKDAYREFREARRMIGVSPQEVNLDKFLTVEETLISMPDTTACPGGRPARGPRSFWSGSSSRGSAGRGRIRCRGV